MQEFKTVEELLSDPRRWTKETYAEDENGDSVVVHSHNACRWCLIGACSKVYKNNKGFQQAIKSLINKTLLGSYELEEWNDAPERTHEEVLDLVRRAGI